MAMNIELYEVLKLSVGEDAARMIADVVPPARDLATRGDVERVRTELADHRRTTEVGFEKMRADFEKVRADFEKMRGDFEKLRGDFEKVGGGLEGVRAEVHSSAASQMRWMLMFFVPLWLGMLGVLGAYVLPRI